MSKLTEFLHKLVDKVGDQSLHEDVNDLESVEKDDTEKESSDAAE